MLIASSPTTSALAPHAADRSWVVFLQATSPNGGIQPILIKGMKGATMGKELASIAAHNPYDIMIVGLVPTTLPEETASAIGAQYGGPPLHDGWYMPSVDLLAYIHNVAQASLVELIAQVHPGAISEHVVGIEEMAEALEVSVPTIRRMVNRREIPFLKWGRILRFVPAEVIASLNQRRR